MDIIWSPFPFQYEYQILDLLLYKIHFRESKKCKILRVKFVFAQHFLHLIPYLLKLFLSFEFIEVSNSVSKHFILCPLDLYLNVILPSEGFVFSFLLNFLIPFSKDNIFIADYMQEYPRREISLE